MLSEPTGAARKIIGQILAAALAAGVLILWFTQVRGAPKQVLMQRDCQNAYAAARTRDDTLAVDQRQPFGLNNSDTAAATCGKFRRSGRL